MAKPKMTLQGPNGPVEATDCEFEAISEPWSEYIVRPPGRKPIKVKAKITGTAIFVGEGKTPNGMPIVQFINATAVRAEELDDEDVPPAVSR